MVEENVPLAGFTTFRIGGNAEYFFTPSSWEALAESILYLRDKGIRYFILGGGSNLLISSGGVEGVVIKSEFNELLSLGGGSDFYVGSSAPIRSLLRFSLGDSLGGLEFLAGVPATLGGALVNNCSFRDKDIFSVVKRVKILNPGNEEVAFLERDEIHRGYRFSSLKQFIVLGAELIFCRQERAKIKEEIRRVVNYRLMNQELGKYCAGCIFKNPKDGPSAGKLIEEAGLKSLRKGKALASLKHANFIINEKGASSSDVVFLIECIKEKVYKKFGVLLEEEIERWQC